MAVGRSLDNRVWSLIHCRILRGFSLLSRSLIAACTDNDVNAVRRLLGESNSNINEGTDDGESLLSLACSAGYYELAQVLLAMNAHVEDRGQKNDTTPLMEAASAGHVDIIRLLISHGADVNALSSTGEGEEKYKRNCGSNREFRCRKLPVDVRVCRWSCGRRE